MLLRPFFNDRSSCASFVIGALIAGIGADAASPSAAIGVVAVLTAVSGLAVVATAWQPRSIPSPAPTR